MTSPQHVEQDPRHDFQMFALLPQRSKALVLKRGDVEKRHFFLFKWKGQQGGSNQQYEDGKSRVKRTHTVTGTYNEHRWPRHSWWPPDIVSKSTPSHLTQLAWFELLRTAETHTSTKLMLYETNRGQRRYFFRPPSGYPEATNGIEKGGRAWDLTQFWTVPRLARPESGRAVFSLTQCVRLTSRSSVSRGRREQHEAGELLAHFKTFQVVFIWVFILPWTWSPIPSGAPLDPTG